MNDPALAAPATVPHAAGPAPLRWLAAHCDPVILGCIILGALVRAYAFGSVPPGLHQDETSAGYDAYALLYYGIDRNGFHNPAALVGWGSGMFALVCYAAMPFIALLGLTPVAVRLPFLIAGIVSLALFAELAKEIHGRQMARIAAFLLAICPWHIIASRWALDANLLPGVLLAAILLALQSLRRPWLLPASFALFGLSLYAYGTAYIAVPVFLAMVIPYAFWHRRWKATPLIVGLLVGGVVAGPALGYAAVNWFKWESIVTPWFSMPRLPSVARYETQGNFSFGTQFFKSAGANILGTLRLLVVQDDRQIWNVVPGFGMIYLFSLPLAVLGFVTLCRECLRREFTPAWFLFSWCVASAVVTLFVDPSINHLNVGMLPLVYCTALGILFVQQRWRTVAIGLVTLYALSFLAYTWTYFNSYPARLPIIFRRSLLEAIRAGSEDPQATVCITEGGGFPYIYALFANREDPNEFLRTVRYENVGEEFLRVASFGRYRFGIPLSFQPEIDVYVVYNGELELPTPLFSTEKLGDFLILRKNPVARPGELSPDER